MLDAGIVDQNVKTAAPLYHLFKGGAAGTGIVYIEPRATIVLPADRTDQTAFAGAGLRFYLTRRFFVRADYRWHTIFTSRDDNEELEEWKVLIACFF